MADISPQRAAALHESAGPSHTSALALDAIRAIWRPQPEPAVANLSHLIDRLTGQEYAILAHPDCLSIQQVRGGASALTRPSCAYLNLLASDCAAVHAALGHAALGHAALDPMRRWQSMHVAPSDLLSHSELSVGATTIGLHCGRALSHVLSSRRVCIREQAGRQALTRELDTDRMTCAQTCAVQPTNHRKCSCVSHPHATFTSSPTLAACRSHGGPASPRCLLRSTPLVWPTL